MRYFMTLAFLATLAVGCSDSNSTEEDQRLGSLGLACLPNQTCNGDLVCVKDVCQTNPNATDQLVAQDLGPSVDQSTPVDMVQEVDLSKEDMATSGDMSTGVDMPKGVDMMSCTGSDCKRVISYAGGYGFTCQALASGEVECSGDNYYGQLGDGTNIDSMTPVKVQGVSNARELVAYNYFVCAILQNKDLMCWGEYRHPYVGDPDYKPAGFGARVYKSGVSMVSIGRWHMCWDNPQGELECQGRDRLGQLGDFEGFAVNDPVVQIASASEHNCAVLASGEVWCWGSSYGNVLGAVLPPTAANQSRQPVQVYSIDNAVKIDVSREMACALLADGEVSCWGDGALRPGVNEYPNRVPGLTGATDVNVVNSNFACALVAGSKVKCWRFDKFEPFVPPSERPELNGAKELVAGLPCAIDTAGKVLCLTPPF